MFTDVFSADDIAAPARRTGFVQRASKSTGQRLLALVTFGSWRDATTTLAPWAAKVTQGGAQLAVSPDASHQRLNHGAGAVLQDMLRQALAKVPALDTVCAEGLLTCCTKGSLADSPGVALPDRVHDLFPGAGGRASTAGATMHAVWEYKSRVCGHFALTPWHMPDQQYLDNVGAFVPQGVWCLGD